jgi:2-phospho-L-lactate guanylyltransferase (CobY/MobA/RfbA family)
MPVNMDPSKKRRRIHPETAAAPEQAPKTGASVSPRKTFGEETDVDREKDLADAELKNLWDATEVIDMDKV